MEEDIKILDEVVGRSKELREKDFGILIGTKQMHSLENLIKGYRELEEKNKNLYDLGKAFANNQLKIKMRNKIDELRDNYWQHDYDVDMNTIQVLQELLEDNYD